MPPCAAVAPGVSPRFMTAAPPSVFSQLPLHVVVRTFVRVHVVREYRCSSAYYTKQFFRIILEPWISRSSLQGHLGASSRSLKARPFFLPLSPQRSSRPWRSSRRLRKHAEPSAS